jgi:hypothetical protein
MRKKVLTILGVLLVAFSTSQIETAAARSVPKKARAPHPQTQQLRDAFGAVNLPPTVQSDRLNHSTHHGLSASTAVESKSCDILWCYEN